MLICLIAKSKHLFEKMEKVLLANMLFTSFASLLLSLDNVKEEIFVYKNFRTFPYKTVCMKCNFVLLKWPKKKQEEDTIEWHASQLASGGKKFGMEIFALFFWNLIRGVVCRQKKGGGSARFQHSARCAS